MLSKFHHDISKYKTFDPVNYNYILVNETSQERYNLTPSIEFDIISSYCKLLSQDPDVNISLFQKSKDYIPLSCTFTFELDRLPEDNDQEDIELYSEDVIIQIIKIFQDFITENFIISEDKFEYICCFLESCDESYFAEDKIIKQFKIHFPYFIIDKELINKDLLKIKINFNTFVERFERENTNIVEFGMQLDQANKIQIILNKFKDYVGQENSTESGQPNR